MAFSRPLFVVCLLLTLAPPLHANDDAGERIQFNRDIRPILSDNCYYCHGFDAANRKADLRLDTFEDATEYAIVPGQPDESELLRRMTTDDPDEIMPPPDTEKTLSPEQIDRVRRWIEQGSNYQQHWAWRPIDRPDVATDGAAAIDELLQQAWQANGVSPVQPATPRERLRRLSFDLRGLPPSAEDVASFQRDPTDASFFAFRDRWMNELAYAEHQAVRWLDLVRWADTSGFVSDEPIASGAYRAWVIESLQRNLPFDEFSTVQLAGDLLPNPSEDDLVASGYNRIVNTNCEAGAIELEQLYKLKGEHVRALGTVWLGMTTGCAECHDHKFDPISARDYYSLAAFYDDLVEAGVYTPGDRREPLHYVFGDDQKSKRARRLRERVTELRAQILASSLEGFTAWETATRNDLSDKETREDFVWVPAELPAPRVFEGEFTQVQRDGRLARQSRASSGQFRRHHAAELMTGYINQGKQKTDENEDAWFVEVWIDAKDRPQMLGIQISHGMYGRLGWQTANYETYYWGEDPSETLGNEQPWSTPKRVKRIGDVPDESGWVRLRVPYIQHIKPVSGKNYDSVGMAWLHTGGHVAWGDSGLELRHDKASALALGETAMRKWWRQPYNRQFFQKRMDLVAQAVRADGPKRDPLQTELVHQAFQEQSLPDRLAELRTSESRLHVLQARSGHAVLVSQQADELKTTRVLNRGDYLDETGPLVAPAFPEFLSGETADENRRLNRLDLARWLFDEASPLVARVYVNRLWHQFYGRGLSETLEDSGTQGDWPSHVELLDFLATEFRDSGWDRAYMVRLLTSTKAYQLSSTPTKALQQADPTNRLIARQGRHRLSAEAIRDSALHASGLLVIGTQVPMESFFPYQPDPYWSRSDKVMYGSRHMPWLTSPAASQYQRSLYTFWKRQNIHPTMLAFDAPTRQECTAKRNITNTPAQALALLNDPIFVEAARVFATRILKQSKSTDEERLHHAFTIALQRAPSPEEQAVLLELLEGQRDHFATHPEMASELLQIGQTEITDGDDSTEVAAWTIVTRSILNLHEFLNRS